MNHELFQGLPEVLSNIASHGVASESRVHFFELGPPQKALECPSAVMDLKSTQVKFTKFLSSEPLASIKLHG